MLQYKISFVILVPAIILFRAFQAATIDQALEGNLLEREQLWQQLHQQQQQHRQIPPPYLRAKSSSVGNFIETVANVQ